VVLSSLTKGGGRPWALPAVVSTVTIASCCLLLTGCSQESPSTGPGATSSSSPSSSSSESSGNHPPAVNSARLVANSFTRNDTVTVEIALGDADGDRVTMRYQWLVNGRAEEGETGPTLNLGRLRRGDHVSVELTPVDARGAVGTAFRTDAVAVENTPPVATRVTIEPVAARPGDELRAAIEGSDPDGDPVTYLVEWWRNGTSLGKPAKPEDGEQEQRTLATERFTRGDLIVAGVTPYDAVGPGRFLVSEPLVLLNRAPVITSSPTGPTPQGLFEYAVTATDPDNDPLTYKLDTAPPGMTIDAGTGKITWQMSSKLKGSQQVRVSVDDGQQGQAFQEFTLAPPPAS